MIGRVGVVGRVPISVSVKQAALFHGKEYDPKQIEFMKETIVVVDENDKPLRAGSKEECIII